MKKQNSIKHLLVAFMAIVAASQINAQVTFNHALGGGIYLNKYGAAPAVVYTPRLNFLELGGRGSESTLSVGVPIALGFAFSGNSREGGSGSFAADLPVFVDVNFGHAANPDADSRFGGFAGIGFAYNIMGGADDYGSFVTKSMGPAANAGIRFVIRERSVGLRASYMFNVKSSGYGASVIGLNLLYNFGQW